MNTDEHSKSKWGCVCNQGEVRMKMNIWDVNRIEKRKKKKPWKPWRLLVAARVSQKLKQICTYRTKGPLWHIKTKAKAELWLWEKGLQWGKIGGRVQINPKSCGKRQTTWRREKEETKSENREEIKAAEENKERDFRGRVQINPKSCGKRQTTWRREKKETKSQNR